MKAANINSVRENSVINLAIIVMAAFVLSALSACQVEEDENNLNLNREIQVPFDVEGGVNQVSVSEERPLVNLRLYMDEEYEVEFTLRSMILLVNDDKLINWDETVIMLDSMLLSPEIEIIEDSTYPNSTRVKIMWKEVPWASLRAFHDITFSLAFNQDVSVGTWMSFWTENMLFNSNVDESSIYQGKPDGFLGDEELSGVRTRRYPRDEAEEVIRYDAAPGTIQFTN